MNENIFSIFLFCMNAFQKVNILNLNDFISVPLETRGRDDKKERKKKKSLNWLEFKKNTKNCVEIIFYVIQENETLIPVLEPEGQRDDDDVPGMK